MTARRAAKRGKSGLADPNTGYLGRPVNDGWLLPGSVRLEGAELIWRETGTAVLRMVESGLLEEFCDLAEAEASEFLRFAKKWGLLEICVHELPIGHSRWNQLPMPKIGTYNGAPCELRGASGAESVRVHRQRDEERAAYVRRLAAAGIQPLTIERPPGVPPLEERRRFAQFVAEAFRAHLAGMELAPRPSKPESHPELEFQNEYPEPIPAWRLLARKFGASVRIAEQLADLNAGRQGDWKVLFAEEAEHPLSTLAWQQSVPLQRDLLSSFVNRWLVWGGSRLHVGWRNNQHQIQVGGAGLLGALAVQLMYSIGKRRLRVRCSECGESYLRDRKPAACQRHYCPQCREEGKSRSAASRDYRSRRQQIIKLNASGRSVQAIAEHLGVDPNRVRRQLERITHDRIKARD